MRDTPIQTSRRPGARPRQPTTPSFVREYRRYDRMMAPLQARMLAAARLGPGQRVVDVGAGAGSTSLQCARIVGPTGEVLAVDSHPAATAALSARANAEGLSQLHAVCADAQHYAFEAGSAHAVVSRFGTLHFREPELAFANLRRALRPGAGLHFLCAAQAEDNHWFSVPLSVLREVAPSLAPQPVPESGPFTLANPAKLRALLAAAGFSRVRLLQLEQALCVGLDVDDALEFYFETDLRALSEQLDAALVEQITAALREALAPYCGATGVYMPASAWLVSAESD